MGERAEGARAVAKYPPDGRRILGMTKPRKRRQTPAFDAQKFLDSVGATKQIVTYEPLARIFGQGDPATTTASLPVLDTTERGGRRRAGVG